MVQAYKLTKKDRWEPLQKIFWCTIVNSNSRPCLCTKLFTIPVYIEMLCHIREWLCVTVSNYYVDGPPMPSIYATYSCHMEEECHSIQDKRCTMSQKMSQGAGATPLIK